MMGILGKRPHHATAAPFVGEVVLRSLEKPWQETVDKSWKGAYNSLPGEVWERRMREFMAMTKALADENRVRILLFLRRGELCVCQIIKVLGLAPSTVSKHLSILHQAGLVEMRKEGRWIYYRLPGNDASPVVRSIIHWIVRALSEDKQVIEDEKRLKAIRRISTEELCECYRV